MPLLGLINKSWQTYAIQFSKASLGLTFHYEYMDSHKIMCILFHSKAFVLFLWHGNSLCSPQWSRTHDPAMSARPSDSWDDRCKLPCQSCNKSFSINTSQADEYLLTSSIILVLVDDFLYQCILVWSVIILFVQSIFFCWSLSTFLIFLISNTEVPIHSFTFPIIFLI